MLYHRVTSSYGTICHDLICSSIARAKRVPMIVLIAIVIISAKMDADSIIQLLVMQANTATPTINR